MGENISIERISMKDVFKIFQMNDDKRSFGQLYDELEWNLVDLPKRERKISMGFFRGKTIVPVWQNRLTEFPPTALTRSTTTSDTILYNITFSSYENYFFYPPYYLFDRSNDTHARTSTNVYTPLGTYKGGGRSEYMMNKDKIVIYGEWVQIEMDVYNTVVKFAITPTRGKPGEAPSKLYFLGFDVDKNWNLLLYQEFDNLYVDDLQIVFYVNKLIPCCKYRLVCAETSHKSSNKCNSFSLCDMVMFGVTRYDKVPFVKLFWENGISYTITSDVSDFDALSDNLVSRRLVKVESSPNCSCVLYVGPNYTGDALKLSNGSPNSIYSSLKITNNYRLDLNFPFNWDGLEYAILFNSVVTFNGNAEVVYDDLRGHVCKFAFGEFNLRIPKLHMRVVFSIMFWMKRSDGDIENLIESSELTVNVADNKMFFTHTGSGVSLVDDTANEDSKWIHYCVSYDNVVFKLYRNGVLHGFIATVLNKKNIDTDIFFGKGWNTKKNIMVDNVRVYNKAIDPAILKHLFDFEYFNANY
jgi:hypothetical protein